MRLLFLPAAAAVLLAGCGESSGRLRGRVVENGQPTEIPGQAALMFTRIGAGDKPDTSKSYTMAVEKDGTFEMVASGGALPPGRYMVTVETTAKGKAGLAKYKEPYKYPTSPLRADVVAGPNDLIIDLAKPDG